jgi:hypothetical protein
MELAWLDGERQGTEHSNVDAPHCENWRNYSSVVSGILALTGDVGLSSAAGVLVNSENACPPSLTFAPFQCVFPFLSKDEGRSFLHELQEAPLK